MGAGGWGSSEELDVAGNLLAEEPGGGGELVAPGDDKPGELVAGRRLERAGGGLPAGGEGLPRRQHVLPPELPQHGVHELPVLPLPEDPEEAAPVGRPAVEIHPVPVHDLHLPLHLRHVVVGHRPPWQPQLRPALVERALHLQDPAFRPPAEDSVRRGAHPGEARLGVHGETEGAHLAAGDAAVALNRRRLVLDAPLHGRPPGAGDGVGVGGEDLLVPQLRPAVPLPEPQGGAEGARRQLVPPEGEPLRRSLRPVVGGVDHRRRRAPEKQPPRR